MAWLDEKQIRDKFNIAKNDFSSQIGSASESAARKIRRWVLAAAYTEAVADTLPAGDDDLFRAETIIDAHAFLTMYYLAVSAGHRMASEGVIKSAQATGSPSAPIVTNQYLTPAELAGKKKDYYNEAREIVEPYLIVETDPPFIASARIPMGAVTVVSDW